MKKILSKVLYLALAIPIFANATSCPTVGNNLIEDAPLFQWTDKGDHFVGTLIMDEVTITLNNGETLTTRAYAQKGQTPTVPGPTIVMEPGVKYILRFENLLPYEPLSDLHNGFKDPNVTNLHTHGVHTTGDTPGDDAVRIFQGGQGGDYVYDIHEDHMGGTFWIHAHHHGSTYLQVSGGAFGLIVIDDGADGIPPSVASMTACAMAERFATICAGVRVSHAPAFGSTVIGMLALFMMPVMPDPASPTAPISSMRRSTERRQVRPLPSLRQGQR